MTADDRHPVDLPVGVASGRIWGLEARDIHDAWWRGRGVQCVHIGSEFAPVPGAELFLLLHRHQMVTFDLALIAESMVWNQSRATRVRIVERDDGDYRETVRLSPAGEVLGIGRHYRAEEIAAVRVFLVTRSDLAKSWAESRDSQEGNRNVKAVGRERLASVRVSGHCFDERNPEDRDTMLQRLVAVWPDPQRVIEGVAELAPGVIGLADQASRTSERLIPPVWMGLETDPEGAQETIVGPDLVPDDATVAPETVGVRVRSINEIVAPRSASPIRLMPSSTIYSVLKRTFDIVVSVLVLLGLSPLFLVVAIGNVVDGGFPIFFGHVRQSRDGRPFKCWKFRTMRKDAESLVEQMKQDNEADGPQVFIRDDPRVTRFGRTLRRLQLDELPQFWNVLIGDMSVVGPRPSPEGENQFCPAWRELRLSVRPGITGLWQVERTRAAGLDFQEWIRFDIEYVRRASFWFDLRICFKTVYNLIARS